MSGLVSGPGAHIKLRDRKTSAGLIFVANYEGLYISATFESAGIDGQKQKAKPSKKTWNKILKINQKIQHDGKCMKNTAKIKTIKL